MYCTEANMQAVLNRITSDPKLSPAMRSIGAGESLVWNWLRRSAAPFGAFAIGAQAAKKPLCDHHPP